MSGNDGNPRYRETVAKVEAFLLEHWPNKPEHAKVDIYTWPDDDGVYGLRVAEVSFSNFNPETHTGGGSSAMQHDVGSGSLLFAVERLILEWHGVGPIEELNDPDKIGDLLTQQWKVLYLGHSQEIADAWDKTACPDYHDYRGYCEAKGAIGEEPLTLGQWREFNKTAQ